MRIHISLGALAFCAVASAQVVVPNNRSATFGTTTFLYMVTTGRTYQMVVNANQLTSLVGQNLTGIEFRLPSSATSSWPPANATFNNYDIYIGPGVAPSARSLTFANNYTGSPTQVRSGSLTFNAGSFGIGSPTTWGPTITFNTPYTYTGGHLTIEMRHDGMTGTTTTRSWDAMGTNTAGNTEYLVDYAAAWTGTYTGTAGSAGNFFIHRITSAPVPEPATLTALGLGALALFRRRRARAA